MLSGTGRRRSRLRLSIDRAFLISASLLASTGLRFEARRARGKDMVHGFQPPPSHLQHSLSPSNVKLEA